MTPNGQHYLLQTLQTLRTRRDADSRAKASRVDHHKIAGIVASARSRNDFTLVLEGDALTPEFQDGDLLTISPHLLPLPGDTVVARIDSRYGCMRLNADGDLWDANGGFVPQGRYSVAGVVLSRRPAP